MKKNILKILLLLSITCFPCYVLAYTESDNPVTSSKVYNFLIDDINSDSVIRLYNSNNETLPSYFNLNDYYYEKYNFHIPVANQKNLGLCENFASVKSIETNYALKTGKFIDISERYLDFMTSSNFLGYRTTGYICDENLVCSTGDAEVDVLSVAQSFGVPLEKEIPFVNYNINDLDLFNNSHNILKLNSYVSFPNLYSDRNVEEWLKIIKIHIMKYGSIKAHICSPNGVVYNPSTASQYTESCPNGGHAVSIVGWDDNYSKNNFKTIPEDDGAFIVLNSWGTGWGNKGYFYISYDDNSVLTQLEGVLDVSETEKYNKYSKSSNMFGTQQFGISELNSIYRFNGIKFDRIGENEYVSHIAVSGGDVAAYNNSSKIKFYLNPIDDTFDKEKFIYLGEDLPSIGNVTVITLDEPIKITGSKYSLVYEITGDASNFTFTKAKGINKGFTYTSKGFDQQWTIIKNDDVPVFVFTVNGIVKNADIKIEPSKKIYIKGQSIDLTGGVLNVTYDDNAIKEIDMMNSSVKLYDYDTNTLGNQKVSLLYEGQILTYNINVKNAIKSMSIKNNPNKTIYSKGENLDLTGGILAITYSDNSFEEILMNDKLVSVTGYDKDTSGVQKLIITYNDKTVDFNVTVLEQYLVLFNSNGGSNVASQTIDCNGKVIKPSNPTRDGYTFKYWTLNGEKFDFDTPVTSDITLVAEWEEVEETLKDILEDNNYTVNNGFVSKFTLGDTITQIKNKLGNNITIETDKTIIATGAVIRKGNESYIVVIKGDLTGDGRVNSGDLLQMRKYLLEEITLTGAYKEAGIIESIGNIKSLDLLRLRQYLLGDYEFN